MHAFTRIALLLAVFVAAPVFEGTERGGNGVAAGDSGTREGIAASEGGGREGFAGERVGNGLASKETGNGIAANDGGNREG